MKRLKRTLKEALQCNASIIRMRVNHLPEFETERGLAKAKTVETIDIDFLSLMFREMFDGGEKFFDILEPCKGRLMVNGYGDFMLLAVPAEKTLLIVPPHDRQRDVFEHLWKNVAGDTGAEVITPSQKNGETPKEPDHGRHGNSHDVQQLPLSDAPQPDHPSSPQYEDIAQFIVKDVGPSIPAPGAVPPPPPPSPAVKPLEVFPQGGNFELNWSLPPSSKDESHPIQSIAPEEKKIPLSVPSPVAKSQQSSLLEEKVFPWNDQVEVSKQPVKTAVNAETQHTKVQAPKSGMISGVLMSAPPRENAPVHHGDDHPSTPSRPQVAAPSKVETKILYCPTLAVSQEAAAGSHPINELLDQMVKQGASDMHMTLGEPVCMRVDGEIVRLKNWVATEQSMPQFIEPIIPAQAKADLLRHGQADFTYLMAAKGRFRLHLYREHHGVAAVVHFVPPVIPTAEKLELSPYLLKWCDIGRGLILITGPAGSGKSTTMAALVDHINATKTKHIITIEETIEYVFEQKLSLVHQVEASRSNHGLAAALNAAQREDPDVVMVSDLCDNDALDMALALVENGHLVIGATPTMGTIATLDRIIERHSEAQRPQIRNALAENLLGIASQLMVKKKGGGRVAAMEILANNATVKSSIKEGKTHMIRSLLQTKKSEGNQLLNEVLVELIKSGSIDPIDAYAKTSDKAELLQLLQQAGIPMRMIGLQVA